MPLDYSKWDNLEISDDSDIECHPNVDKRSMIRWKQQAIHRERAERKAKIEQLEQFIPLSTWVVDELDATIASVSGTNGLEQTKELLQRAKENGRGIVAVAMPPKKDDEDDDEKPKQPVTLEKALTSIIDTFEPRWQEESAHDELLERLKGVRKDASDVLEKSKSELEKLKKEASKKLTMENMFRETSNRTILNKSKPKTPSKTTKKKEKVIETLNPGAQMKDLSIADQKAEDKPAEESDDDTEGGSDLELSKEAQAFLKCKDFEASYKHLLRYPEIVKETYSDQLLAEAFTSQLKGREEYARHCVVQSLTLQYCGQLQRGGIERFFKKMIGGDEQARRMFFQDVDQTYGRIKKRTAEILAERANEQVETIQLQTANDGSQITVRIPDPNVEDQKQAYEVFMALPEAFREALKTGELEKINKVLEKTPVKDAETLVQVCSEYGFLDVGDQVIDQTQQQQQQQQ